MGDSKFGCGYTGAHLAAVDSSNALALAVADANITCIKLAPMVFALTATLFIDRTLALVAEEGRATLDGGGSVQLMQVGGSACVTLHNLELSDGFSNTTSPGGAICNFGTIEMHICVITGTIGILGTIYNSGTMEMYGCSLMANKQLFGGAIYNDNPGTMMMRACILANNSASLVRPCCVISLCSLRRAAYGQCLPSLTCDSPNVRV